LKLIIVSGLSGSGKTIALHTLEDAGYYCIDNLPVGMLPDLVDNMVNANPDLYDLVAIAIDARSGIGISDQFGKMIEHIKRHPILVEILFLSSSVQRLLARFSETRRKHPLSRSGLPLIEAIEAEKKMLEPILTNADLSVDSSNLNVHELRQVIISRLLSESTSDMAILIQSFGFKHGSPADTDFLFDVRCLPNPHWEEHLRPLTGRDQAIVDYLETFPDVSDMHRSITHFLNHWMPRFESENRSYMTVSIGCTGGRHRSVYLVEKIASILQQRREHVSIRHRELG